MVEHVVEAGISLVNLHGHEPQLPQPRRQIPRVPLVRKPASDPSKITQTAPSLAFGAMQRVEYTEGTRTLGDGGNAVEMDLFRGLEPSQLNMQDQTFHRASCFQVCNPIVSEVPPSQQTDQNTEEKTQYTEEKAQSPSAIHPL